MDQHPPYSPFRDGHDGSLLTDANNRARAFSSPGRGARGGGEGNGLLGGGSGNVGGIDLSSLSFGGGSGSPAAQVITAPTTPLSAGTGGTGASSSMGVVFPLPSPSPSQQPQQQQQQQHSQQPISPPVPSPGQRSPHNNLAGNPNPSPNASPNQQPLSTQGLSVAGLDASYNAQSSPIGTALRPSPPSAPSSGMGAMGGVGIGAFGLSPSSRASGTSPIGTTQQQQQHYQEQQQQQRQHYQEQQLHRQFLVPAQLAIPSMSGDSSNRQHQHQQRYQQEHPQHQHQHSPPVGDENRAPSDDHDNGVGEEEEEADLLLLDEEEAEEVLLGHSNDDDDDANNNKVKLFVGQVPKTSNESDLMPIFAPYGPIADVAIIRDRFSSGHRGCAFVTYLNAADAERAMEDIHDNVKFDRSKRPLQVRVASEPGLSRGSSHNNESEVEHKLFVGMLSRSLGEREVKAMFDAYGLVRSVFIIRNNDGTRKGCAFVRMSTQEGADAAIESLSGNFTCPDMGRPMIVKYADNKYQKRARLNFHHTIKRDPVLAPARPGAAASAGGYPVAAFGGGGAYPAPQAGYYQQQYQYAPSPNVAQQDGGHVGQDGAVDMSAQAGGQQHAYNGTAGAPSQGYGMYQQAAGSYHGMQPGGAGAGTDGGGGGGNYQSTGPRPKEGPPGANLFIYHLPHDLTDADLATAFDPFGNVVSAKVYVDRHTGESKGFGFVSYDSIEAADSAIEHMNGFQIGAKRLKVQHKRVHSRGGGGGGSRSYAQQQQYGGGDVYYGGQYGRNSGGGSTPLMPAGQGDVNALSGNFSNLSTSNGMGANEETF